MTKITAKVRLRTFSSCKQDDHIKIYNLLFENVSGV